MGSGLFPYTGLSLVIGGESGIRTHGTVAGTTVFKTILLNHSSISPGEIITRYRPEKQMVI